MTTVPAPATPPDNTAAPGAQVLKLPVVLPLDPRTRALVIGFRRVFLLAADVLGEYAGLPPRGRD